jgi:hypothetical protein
MLMTKRKPVSVGEILIEEFMRLDTNCVGQSNGRAAQARQRAVQQSP